MFRRSKNDIPSITKAIRSLKEKEDFLRKSDIAPLEKAHEVFTRVENDQAKLNQLLQTIEAVKSGNEAGMQIRDLREGNVTKRTTSGKVHINPKNVDNIKYLLKGTEIDDYPKLREFILDQIDYEASRAAIEAVSERLLKGISPEDILLELDPYPKTRRLRLNAKPPLAPPPPPLIVPPATGPLAIPTPAVPQPVLVPIPPQPAIVAAAAPAPPPPPAPIVTTPAPAPPVVTTPAPPAPNLPPAAAGGPPPVARVPRNVAQDILADSMDPKNRGSSVSVDLTNDNWGTTTVDLKRLDLEGALVVGGQEMPATEGLLKLILLEDVKDTDFTPQDVTDYELLLSNASLVIDPKSQKFQAMTNCLALANAAAATGAASSAAPPAGQVPTSEALDILKKAAGNKFSQAQSTINITVTTNSAIGRMNGPPGAKTKMEFDVGELEKTGNLKINGQLYPDTTPGLLNLLFVQQPAASDFTSDDARKYAQILKQAGATLSSSSDKYKTIRDKFGQEGIAKSELKPFLGKGLFGKGKKKAESESEDSESDSESESESSDDEIDPFTHRLKILVGSINAGNNGKKIKSEVHKIINILLKQKKLTKKEHYKLLEAYVL